MPRGGFRPGAGRNPKAEEEKTQVKAFTLPLDVIEYLKTKPNASKYVTSLIREEMKRE